MQLGLIAALVFGALAVLFALQNAATVTVVFFVWRADASLALVIIVCVGLGALLSAFAAFPALLRARVRLRHQRRRIEELERSREIGRTGAAAEQGVPDAPTATPAGAV